MEKVLSVSVACYNLRDMIEDNIKSFCESESRDKIELIIVDGGSKDNTIDYVRKYLDKYPNTIKLIVKQNEGAGSTVNYGIKNATGKYFRMLDGDDIAMTKNLDAFIDFLEKCDADMVISDYCHLNNKTKELFDERRFKDLPAEESLNFDEVQSKLPNEMHTIAYKTSILQDNKITLDNGYYTDTEYVLYPIPYVKTVSYFNDIIYVYRVENENQSVSITSLVKNRAYHQQILSNLIAYYLKKRETLSLPHREYILNRIKMMIWNQTKIFLFVDDKKQGKQEAKEFLTNLKQTDDEIYAYGKKNKLVKLLLMSNYLLFGVLSKHFKNRERSNY